MAPTDALSSASVPCPARLRRGGILRSALALIVFLVACAVLGWMLILPLAVQREIESRTGFPTEIGSLSSNPVGFSVSGKAIEVINSPDFGEGSPFLEIRSFAAQGATTSLLRSGVRLSRLELDISKAILTVDERGRLNLRSFADSLLRPPEQLEATPFHVEHVRLNVEEVVFVDNSRPLPVRRSIRALLEVDLHDVNDIESLFAPLVELGQRIGALKTDVASGP